ncbi:hypothetical protein [Pelagibacterium montanilacus]|uniref:hypothetical protein n=1 Tax=Pelagibacterium montanilacus TaxID=2185280 RepID=UPI000F8D84C5|nr:hypothetical protein [Pelagibacterium montanilacus]
MAVPAQKLPGEVTDLPAIVLIGQSDNEKPRGSWFAKTDRASARKAAALTGMKIVPVKSGKLTELALKLPKGRIFSSGKAFAPLIQPKVYEALLPHAGNAPAPKGGDLFASGDAGAPRQDKAKESGKGDAAAKPKESFPPDWARISVGHTVLAYSPDDEAWFEALVVEAAADGKFVLKWRDYPEDDAFTKRRADLALKFPEGQKAAG